MVLRMLAVLNMRDYAAEGNPRYTIALLADARGTRAIRKWKPGEYPQSIYSAMDEVGKEGWIIGSALWVPFGDGQGDLGMKRIQAVRLKPRPQQAAQFWHPTPGRLIALAAAWSEAAEN
jgi:hypothetical protein